MIRPRQAPLPDNRPRSDGAIIDNEGTIVQVAHGRLDGSPVEEAQTFRALLTVVGLHPGDVAPTMAQQQLAASDFSMARVGEDGFITMLNKGLVQRTDIPQAALEKINQRRTWRNQGTI